MKILHCADIHLDSPVGGVADSGKRRSELLLSFSDAIEYASNNGVGAVLIAGDLFDGDFVSQSTINSVLSLFKNNSKIEFFAVCGNHGGVKAYNFLKRENLKNLHFFGSDKFQTFEFSDAAISGVELNGKDDAKKYDALSLPDGKFNVVMLHGDVDSSEYGFVDLKALSEKGCDYLALGHRHSFSESKRGKMQIVYSGILESRGFDETFDSGFVILDTESRKHRFVKQARRRVETVEVDASGLKSNLDLLENVKKAIAFVSRSNYLNLILKGELSDGVSVAFLKESLDCEYFALRIENQTKTQEDYKKLAGEISLKGEFVKLALKIENPSLQNDVLTLGLAALSGEELKI